MNSRSQLVEKQIARVRDVIRRQHKSLATEYSYLGWLRRYFHYVFGLPPAWDSRQKFEAFLTMLARDLDVAESTQAQAFNAILFFYRDVEQKEIGGVDALRATRPKHIRHAPSVPDTRKILAQIKDVGGYPTNLICRLLYGCGLRVSEPLNLRVKDMNFPDSRLFILGAKGGKDRVVNLPCSVAPEMQRQLEVARAIYEQDFRNRIPLEIPHGLARKYPETKFAWEWAWIFPAHAPCRHPRTGEIVRYRMHECNVQRAVKQARAGTGVFITPHNFRHAYGTHCLDRGANIAALSKAMGHSQIQTTAGYCHAEALSVASPLETFA